jgi:asparagine synthase (glutamine-hydrolysing)
VSAPPLTPVDLATGVALGAPRRAPALLHSRQTPISALEAAILPAVRRGPCLVSFSGGRDSSAVLAVATRLARREGLPDPIPATNRVPGAAGADESAWQEAVVAHLGLSDWLKLEWRNDELDAVGSIARTVLARHGLLWPCNTHFHQPLLAAARGGTVLTGVGGDELSMALCPDRPSGRLTRRALSVALWSSPALLRRPWLERRRPLHLPWLTEAGMHAATAAAARHVAKEPMRVPARLAWARAQRYLGVGQASLHLVAAGEGAAIEHPLLAVGLWAALATRYPRGLENRTAAMATLFGDVLPLRTVARDDKAGFDAVFCGPHARAAASEYTGAGAPAALVDAAALRAHWAAGDPRPQSLTLLQAAYLSGVDRREECVDRSREALPDLRPTEFQHRE